MAFGASKSGVRKASFAGSFYPKDKESLLGVLEKFFRGTSCRDQPEDESSYGYKGKDRSKLKALIVPHAGYTYCGKVAASGYGIIPADMYDHYVLMGPSHRHFFLQIAGSPDSFWETPLGPVGQIPWGEQINQNWHEDEHSLEVQLPYLQFVNFNRRFSTTCLLTGMTVDAGKYAHKLSSEFQNSFFIVSSDLSHYLPDREARQVDAESLKAIGDLDSKYFLSREESACGRLGIAVLLELAQFRNWTPRVVMYDTSAGAGGDFTSVVGYACVGFFENRT